MRRAPDTTGGDLRGIPVTAVVVSYNSQAYLRCTLEALRAQRGVEPQIIVVDNASTDNSPEMVRREFPDVELLANTRNQGLSGGANRGIERSLHPFVCTMNEDVELAPDALAIMAAYLESHPSVGAVGPHLRNTDGSLQPSGLPLPTAADVIGARYHLRRPFPRKCRRDFEQDCAVGVVPGACVMVTQKVLETVGGYDEHNFFVNWEDIDWCRRISEAGYAVHYVAGARGIHHLGVSTATNTAMVSMTGRSGAIQYFRKHQGRVVALMLRTALLPGDLFSLATLNLRSVFSPRRRRRARLAASILAVTWLDQRPWVQKSRRKPGIKKVGKSIIQKLLRLPGMAAVGESVTRFLGRRWPDSELSIAPRFQIIDHLLGAGKPTERVCRLPGGARLVVDVADYAGRRLYFCLSHKINRGWLYEPETTRFLWNWLRPGDTFIDVGANAGYFSAMAASIVGRAGRVHAFEPNPQVSRLLDRTVERNGYQERMRVNPLAVTDRAGSVQLWCRPDGRATDDATTVQQAGRVPVQVDSITLDAYCKQAGVERIRLIKIDVEGAELDVFRGASHVLTTIRPDAFVIEFAPVLLSDSARTWTKLLATFSSHHYSIRGLDMSGSPAQRGHDAPTWEWGNVCFLSDSSLSPVSLSLPSAEGRESGR